MANEDTRTRRGNGSRDESGLTPTQRTWLSHIRRCEAEGVSYKAYCQREGLKVDALYAARKVLRRCGSRLEPSTSPPRFAAVRLARPTPMGSTHVMLPNGVQMAVSVADIDDLARLVQALARLLR